MSLYQKASLVQIPSGYKASSANLYSVVPNNGDGDFTVSSDADATRVNKDGLIESVSANQARLNYDPTNPQDPHLLLEPIRLNRVYPNNTLSGYSVLNATVSNNNSTSPDGASNASLITSGSGGTTIGVFRGFTCNGGNYHNFSVFLKKGTYDRIKVQEGFASANMVVNLTTGTEVSSQNATNKKIEEYRNGWYRVSFDFISASSGNLQYALFVDGTTATGITFYTFGGQIEQGKGVTSLIPTSGGTATRTEDFCNIPSGLGNVLNTSEGTLFVDVEVPRVSTTSDFDRIVLSDQTASTDRLIFDDFGGNWRVLLLSTAGNVNKTIVGVTANQRIKVAIAYSSTGLRISYDGNTALTTSGSYTPTTTLESFKFSNKDGGSKWQGKIYQAIYFPTALTNAELQTLTS